MTSSIILVIAKMSRGYLNRTELSETIKHDPDSFQYVGHRTHQIEVDFPYTPLRGAPPNIHWPPKGVRVDVTFKAPQSAPTTHQGITVTIHYQIYDGIPAMSKWVSVQADQRVWDQVTCTLVSIELLAVNQPFSKISTWDGYTFKPDGADNAYDWLYIDLNRPYGGLVTWLQDPAQAQVAGSFQPLLNVSNSVPVPVVSVGKDGYTSFKVNELIHCSEDPTRKSLSKNRLLKLLAPHVQENPIFFHMTDSRSEQFRATVDQLAEVGFEMIIYSFGSGLYMEEENETYLDGVRKDVAYANSKGMEVGGYDLIVLDRGDLPKEMRATDAQGNPGGNACLASEWYETIYGKLLNFMTKTNMTMVETDGPYGGGSCHSTTHAHHKGYGDSVYKQNMLQERMYNEFRRRSFYINSPDTYYYGGSNRNGLGYNENQYSLPRWIDLGISRQTVFDRVYSVPPTAGWMFVPLQDYHGGGEAAAFEPLQQHLAELNFAFAQYLGAGVAACYRGNRIYDSDATKELVQHWVSFYKKYRALVTSDIIRITRPDMQNIDAFMHVNWQNEDDKALVMVFNPTAEKRNVTLGVPVYYTGIRYKALVSEQEAGYVLYDIGVGPQGIEIEIEVELEARSTTWFKIKPTTS